MSARPPAWVAPGNDYRGIRDLHAEPAPSVAVVVRRRPGDGEVTRARVESQAYDGEFVVVETDAQSITAATEGCDVVISLVAGDVPADGWLQAHADWHRKAGNVVVIGPSTDASSRIVRGSRLLLGNDEAFAALTPSNVSLPRAAWLNGIELDSAAGWTLWNDGYFFAYEPAAVLASRARAPEAVADGLADIALENAISHRRFRPQPSAFHAIPKVSWVIGVGSAEEAVTTWKTCQQSSFPDHEIVMHGPAHAVAAFVPVAVDNPRLSVVPGDGDTLGAALSASRGELVILADPRVRVAAEIVSKAVARFEGKPSAPVIRIGYDVDGARYLRLDDLAAIDSGLGRDGLPFFAVVTRRELMKDHSALSDPAMAWSRVLDRSEQSLIVSPLVGLSGPSPTAPRAPGLKELASIGVRETAKAVVREARGRRARSSDESSPPEDQTEGTTKISVAYVGFTGHDNLGDEAVRVAIERLMPWAEFETDPADPKLLMVGGGTLINGRRYYLNRMLRQESASVERALFGTGVRSPEYWGVTEPMEDWFSFIDAALFAAVRGPDSVENLRTLGYGRDLPIIGDPALYLEPVGDVDRVEGRVVVCPVFTNGNLHGGSDDDVFDSLARLIGRARAEGRDVVMLSAFPQDDRWVIDIMRRASAPDLAYLAGYADIDETMSLLASADVVVGERLHAAIMAAAAGTPFVGLEYRPKMRDFARSVGQEDAVIRTDQMDRLDDLFDRVTTERESIVAELDKQVSEYRARQKTAADQLYHRLRSL